MRGGLGDGAGWLAVAEGCRRRPGPPLPGPSRPPLTSGSASPLLSPGEQFGPSWASSPPSSPPAGTGLLCSFHLITRPESHITSHPPSSGRFLSPHRRPGTVRGEGPADSLTSSLGSGQGGPASWSSAGGGRRGSTSGRPFQAEWVCGTASCPVYGLRVQEITERNILSPPPPTPPCPPTSAPRLFNRSRAVVSLSFGKSSGKRKLSAQL